MIIIGAKGLAKELLEIAVQNGEKNIVFYDDVSNDLPEKLYNIFPILRSEIEADKYISQVDSRFVLGLGNPHLRQKMFEKFKRFGGIPFTLISKNAEIGSFENEIGEGTIVTSGVIITNSIKIGKGALINLNCTIGHDTVIGDFVELTPNVNISGHCLISNNVFIGTSASIIPNISIGKNTVIGAGSVVTKDLPENVLAVGIPAVIKKNL